MHRQQHCDVSDFAHLRVTDIVTVQNARGAEVKDTRSGRVSKLTERFSLYRASSTNVKQQAAIGDVKEVPQYDEDLTEVAAALCDLGQAHNSHPSVNAI